MWNWPAVTARAGKAPSMNRVRIEIMGSGYTLSTPESEDYVQSLAAEINEQIETMMGQSPKISLTDALVLCCMNYADCYQKSERSADHMRAQLSDYLEDAAKARIELDDAKREIEKLRQRMDAAQTGSGN